MKEHIQYDFLQDGHFAELKKAELLEDRINALGSIENYIGTFSVKSGSSKNVLNMTDAEIDEMQKQINKRSFLTQKMVVLLFQMVVLQDIPSIDGEPILQRFIKISMKNHLKEKNNE